MKWHFVKSYNVENLSKMPFIVRVNTTHLNWLLPNTDDFASTLSWLKYIISFNNIEHVLYLHFSQFGL